MRYLLCLLLLVSSAFAGRDRSEAVVAIRVRAAGTCFVDQYGKKTCKPGRIEGTGSGVIVDRAQYRATNTRGVIVLTAAHVVRGSHSVEVKIGGDWKAAYLQGSIPGNDDVDLCLLACECDCDIPPIPLAIEDPVGPEPIESLGHDEGLGNVVRPDEGTISGPIVNVEADDGSGTGTILRIRSVRKMRTRYSSTFGRSGGAVVDCESRLVGVISNRHELDTRESHCTPVSVVREFMRSRWRIPPAAEVEEVLPPPEPPPAPMVDPQPTPVSALKPPRDDAIGDLQEDQRATQFTTRPYVRSLTPSIVLPLPYVDCPTGICPRPIYRSPPVVQPAMPSQTSRLPCACLTELASLKARLAVIEQRPGVPGPRGPAGLPGERGPQGEPGDVAAVPQEAVDAAVTNYLKSNPSAVTVVIMDNGKQVFSKSGVPAGSTIRVPISRTEKSDVR